MRQRSTRFSLRRSRGTAAVEFALVAPVLIVLMVGVVDFGTAYWEQTEIDNAAWAGAAFASVHGYTGGGTTGITAAMTSATGLTLTPSVGSTFYGCPTSGGITTEPSATTTCPSGSGGGTARTYVTVTATATYSLILTYPGFTSPMTLSSTVTARIQ